MERLCWAALFALTGLFLGIAAGWGGYSIITLIVGLIYGLATWELDKSPLFSPLLTLIFTVVVAILGFTVLNIGSTVSGLLFLVGCVVVALFQVYNLKYSDTPQANAAHR